MSWIASSANESADLVGSGGADQLAEVAAADRTLAHRIIRQVRQYAAGERVDIKKLKGRPGEWRIRVGRWRVIFTVLPELDAIVVRDVLERGEAYE
jgi:mRNA-degrading endonuclease RelE of RelBE toxin-antitoxin system